MIGKKKTQRREGLIISHCDDNGDGYASSINFFFLIFIPPAVYWTGTVLKLVDWKQKKE